MMLNSGREGESRGKEKIVPTSLIESQECLTRRKNDMISELF